MKKLKIAQLVLPWIPLPPPEYAGTEWVVHSLTEELVKRGHDVTLFSVGESKTSAKLDYVFDKAFGLQDDVMKTVKGSFKPWRHVAHCFSQHNKFDVIHSHAQFNGLPFADVVDTPTLNTFHRVYEFENKDEKELLEHYSHLNYASISDSQRTMDLNFVGTVHNGISTEKFSYQEEKEDFLLWVGRVVDKKGPKEAIKAAKKSGEKLILIGKKTRPEYFEKEIKPLIDGDQIKFLGSMPQSKLVDYYQRAKAFLFPIKWNEPFGLVPVEAMSCGTPVVAFKNGGVTETVLEGKTGYLVNQKEGVDGLVTALKKIKKIRPADCRSHVESNFSVSKMAENYEKLYYKLLKE